METDYGRFLAEVIVFNRCRTLVEIRVQFGYNTEYMCMAASVNGGTVYGYDIFDVHGLKHQFPQFATKDAVEAYLKSKNVSNFKLTKVDTFTEEFRSVIKEDTKGQIDFAFIDGCHSYKGIKNDFDVVYPLLSPTGIIAFHDTLMIDGCREFMIDLRTTYFDGTFDVVDLPWGLEGRRCGVSLLFKRSFPLVNIPINEVCNLEDTRPQILKKEQDWYKSELAKYSK